MAINDELVKLEFTYKVLNTLRERGFSSIEYVDNSSSESRCSIRIRTNSCLSKRKDKRDYISLS